ncbi:hypothetical protein AGOR_G00169840 [Albula goreensis]|uniref:Uncharacterized protein n=1 Tax=Albula goreensis TaxID=1534307 RepID=A0A8T3D633_9TELE|nr:hypothetical protein AGOR_G00169840 [Albula goreensis]
MDTRAVPGARGEGCVCLGSPALTRRPNRHTPMTAPPAAGQEDPAYSRQQRRSLGCLYGYGDKQKITSLQPFLKRIGAADAGRRPDGQAQCRRGSAVAG